MAAEHVQLTGHLIDSGQLARTLDTIMEHGADYEMVELTVGKRHDDESSVTLQVTAATDDRLAEVLAAILDFGAVPMSQSDARLEVADLDACFPEQFYSTTNMRTEIRVEGQWIPVETPEMDCGVIVEDDGAGGHRARTIPMLEARAGDRIVVGFEGVRIDAGRNLPSAGQPRDHSFGFMSSDVSSEKPQGLMVKRVAQGMRDAKADGRRILWVAGPALVHTGSVPATVALVRAGYLDVLFAGNALPTHDIENAIYGTSLGVSQALGIPTEHGHSHHIRAINTVRRAGSIAAAVEQGLVTSGIMHACVEAGVEMVLAGSVRDDGPLPDVIVDMQVAQSAMRALLPDVGYTLVVCTMLHGIATGNLLPAEVPLVCVDINPATVTKLADRGSAQATGIVTDVGLFVKGLAEELAPAELQDELAAAADRAEALAAR
ncbi:MAG: TIGR00300 family protein [Actinobacteria bacterium]|nr:TIGR00300 family protein [Actinomycetota bacterium]